MQMDTPKRLTRSRTDRMIAGVCGGLAQYFDLDVSIIRILFVVLTIFTAAFPGILVYIIMWIVVPEQ
jgi:phage shock protein PspC (stress-responsive transcriptional regulator)